jgi:glucose/arabinose dehydrogenase
MGSDDRGNHIPPEELNHIVEGGHYGWPFCYGQQEVDRKLNVAPMDTTREAYCAATRPSVLDYQAHSAPIGFLFYTADQFPAAYQGDAFIAFRGSWNRTPPSGYKVVRLKFADGKPAGFEDFLTGFLVDQNDIPEVNREHGVTYQFARIAGLAVAKDGSLLVADDSNGVIYRIAYTGDGRGNQ